MVHGEQFCAEVALVVIAEYVFALCIQLPDGWHGTSRHWTLLSWTTSPTSRRRG